MNDSCTCKKCFCECEISFPKYKASIGEPAPPFTAMCYENGNFHSISLSSFKGKWVILFFYPHDFTLVCPTEICSFNDSISTFEKLNTVIIGASTDSMFVHRAFALKPRKEGGLSPLTIPLISDITHSISKEYGCYINKGPHEGATVRATYIIDPKGILRHISMNDLNVGRSIDELKRLVEAFQFTDEYGDVCPMNWKPGKRAMKGDLDAPELKKYFEEQLGKENN